MVKDPKQIITPYAFDIHPDLLGLPLATPKRRFAALLIDLLVASILSSLGGFLLATAATAVFFWLAIRTKSNRWWKNILRYSGAAIASVFVFAISYHYTKGDPEPKKPASVNAFVANDGDTTKVKTRQEIDWTEFSNQLMAIDYTDEEGIEQFARDLEAQYGKPETDLSETDYYPAFYETSFLANLSGFQTAVSEKDTVAMDSLRTELAPVIASLEINNRENKISLLESENSVLEDRNEELQEVVDNPSFLRTVKATAEDFGLTVGWIGVYFVLSLALFKGRTLGKKLLGLKVIRLNKKPIGIWYSFERFGGYAAGVATGLLGFFQVYWDPNRQAIHDKIASTVVVDLREKKKKKFKELTREVRQSENLLEEDDYE